MKHFISLVLAGMMTAVSVTFSSPTVMAETEHHDNVLITYFSRAGENYNVGVVERGNTDLLAGIVAEETGGELFRIGLLRNTRPHTMKCSPLPQRNAPTRNSNSPCVQFLI